MDVDILQTVEVVRTPRLVQLEGMFDLPVVETSQFQMTASLPIDARPWSIGMIVGGSGSGKTTLARNLWPDAVSATYDWHDSKSVVDGFPEGMPIKVITGLLSSVGFSSPPAWQRPYRCLSNGEQFRVSLARALAESGPERVTVFDEFTSVVDRTVAQIGSAAVGKAVRREERQFVAVTCHYDVEEWLQPDWKYDTSSGVFTWRSLRRRPQVSIEVTKATNSVWSTFRRHHYLSESLSCSCKCFVGRVNGELAVFTAVTSFPHPKRSGWREHRTVCLPDFQGVGIGNAMSEFVAGMYAATRKPYRSITSHPAMIAHRAKSPLWRMTRTPSLMGTNDQGDKVRLFGRMDSDIRKKFNANSSVNRITASFEYVGPRLVDEARAFGILDKHDSRQLSRTNVPYKTGRRAGDYRVGVGGIGFASQMTKEAQLEGQHQLSLDL
jgi:hypothetical protein